MAEAVPLVTVVVITRNRCDRLRRCLASLYALPDPIQVVVVDNASTDDTAAMVRQGFPAARYLGLADNAGAVARTIGAGLATTGYVAFCDDDSGWEPGALSRAVAILDAHPRLALLAAHVLVRPSGRPDPICTAMAAAPWGADADLPGPSVLGFLAFAVVVRREAFLATGGFDALLLFMGEEQLVAYDLARAGHGLAYCPEVVAWHEPERRRPDESRDVLQVRNRVLSAWMRRPWRLAGLETLRLAIRAGHSRTARRALGAVLVRLPRALRRRRPPDPMVETRLAVQQS